MSSVARSSAMRTTVSAVLVGLFLLSTPARANADGYVAPFLGGAMGGNATNRSTSVGVSGGWLGAGWLGVEGDVTWSPEFFGQNGFIADRRLVTAMANVVVSTAGGEHVQPYLTGGVGVLKPRVSEAGGLFQLDTNHFGMNVGGGAMMFFNRSVGVRGDLRYFRGLRDSASDERNDFAIDLSSFHYWRIAGGLAVRF
jgi:opacity protein-like surface antigen